MQGCRITIRVIFIKVSLLYSIIYMKYSFLIALLSVNYNRRLTCQIDRWIIIISFVNITTSRGSKPKFGIIISVEVIAFWCCYFICFGHICIIRVRCIKFLRTNKFSTIIRIPIYSLFSLT